MKNNLRKYIYILTYIVLLILISILEINDENKFMIIINNASTIIPSIESTSSISPNRNSAILILLISWLAIIPLYVYSIKKIDNMTTDGWESIKKSFCDFVGVKNIFISFTIVLLGVLAILFGVYFYNPLGGHSWRRLFFYNLIHSSNMFMPIWGVFITCGVWAILVFLSIMVYGIYKKERK